MTVSTTKGTDIFEQLLLGQYKNSTNFKEYAQCFIDEMDTLFAQTEEVYLGRFLDNAVGQQLDIIGLILDEERSIDIPTQFFGFSDDGVPPANVAPLADEAVPSDGGVFRDETQGDTTRSALGDQQYSRLLKAKALLVSEGFPSVNSCYEVVSTLLGFTPKIMELNSTGAQNATLTVSAVDVTLSDAAFLQYFSVYLAPLGTTFSILRV